jgi:hypothetical protein
MTSTDTRSHLYVSVPTSWGGGPDPPPPLWAPGPAGGPPPPHPALTEAGVLVSARAPAMPPSGVRPELTVRVVAVDPGGDLVAWRADALGDLADALVDFELEDDDGFDLAGHDVRYHRFAHRVGTADVLCDQWAWLLGDRGVTLTCSAAREDYPDYCDLFEAIAATLDPAAG